MAYNNMGRMSGFLHQQMQAAPGGSQRNTSQHTGNPMGANNMPRSMQRPDLGRYRPPTFSWSGANGMNWNDQGGYSYNIPDSYGTPGNYYDSGFQPNFTYEQPQPSFYGQPGPMRPSIMNSYFGGNFEAGSPFDYRSLEALTGQQGQSLPGNMNNKGPAPTNDVATRPQFGDFYSGRRMGNTSVSAFGTGRNRPMLGGRGGLFQNGFAGTPAAFGSTPLPMPVTPGGLTY